MTGFVVAVDGPNYAGKTTLCVGLMRALLRRGIAAQLCTGISGGPVGSLLSRHLDDLRRFPNVTEALIEADKWLFWEERIVPAPPGEVFVFDRFHLSVLAYQALAGRSPEHLSALLARLPSPNLTFLLTPSAEQLADRRRTRPPVGHIERHVSPVAEAAAFAAAETIAALGGRSTCSLAGDRDAEELTAIAGDALFAALDRRA